MMISKLLHLFVQLLMLSLVNSVQAVNVRVNVKAVNQEPIANVAVYAVLLKTDSEEAVQPLPQSVFNGPQKPIISQKDNAFKPFVSIAQRNRAVSFVNDDEITHHIYSAIGENRFSFKLNAKKKRVDKVFEKVGVIPMGCNIHDWMSGYLLVVDTPFIALTDHLGKAGLNLPEKRRYRVVVWHPKFNENQDSLSQIIELNKQQQVLFQLSEKVSPIPKQEGVDDFDFLDDY